MTTPANSCPGNRRCSVTVEAIGPSRAPRQLIPGESRRMNLNDDIVYRCLRLGPLHQLHPGRSRSPVRHNDRLHRSLPLCRHRSSPFDGNASSRGAQRRYIRKLCHVWRDETRVGHPWTGGHAFWNPERRINAPGVHQICLKMGRRLGGSPRRGAGFQNTETPVGSQRKGALKGDAADDRASASRQMAAPGAHAVGNRNYSRGVLDTIGSSIDLPWHQFEGGNHGKPTRKQTLQSLSCRLRNIG